MSDNVSEGFDLSDPTVVDSLLNDKDLRKLPLGSDEFKAAANAKFAKTDAVETQKSTESAAEESEHVEGDAEEADPEAKPKQKRKGVEKRIDELVREREALKKELEYVKAGKPSAQEQEVEQAVEKSTFSVEKPKFKDFDNLEDYTEALTDWKLEQREHDRAQADEQKRVKQETDQRLSTWESREDAFKKSTEDYDDYVNVDSLKALRPDRTVMAYIADSEVGPELIYSLLSDDEAVEKFKDLPIHRQIGMLAKLEAKLEPQEKTEEVDPKTKTSTVTKAPQPAKSLPKGKAVATSKSIYDRDLSFAEYNRMMDERDRAKKAR